MRSGEFSPRYLLQQAEVGGGDRKEEEGAGLARWSQHGGCEGAEEYIKARVERGVSVREAILRRRRENCCRRGAYYFWWIRVSLRGAGPPGTISRYESCGSGKCPRSRSAGEGTQRKNGRVGPEKRGLLAPPPLVADLASGLSGGLQRVPLPLR